MHGAIIWAARAHTRVRLASRTLKGLLFQNFDWTRYWATEINFMSQVLFRLLEPNVKKSQCSSTITIVMIVELKSERGSQTHRN